MRFDHFEFGGLDVVGVRRELDGILTILSLPPIADRDVAGRVGRDLLKVGDTIARGRSPSPVIGLLRGEGADHRPSDPTRGWLDPFVLENAGSAVLILAQLREDGCPTAPVALAQHVVFGRAGGAVSSASLDVARDGRLAGLRDVLPSGGDDPVTIEALVDAGLVDVTHDGEAADAMVDYVRRNDRRRNGELGIQAAIRLRALRLRRLDSAIEAEEVQDDRIVPSAVGPA